MRGSWGVWAPMKIRTNTAGCNLGPPDDEDVIEEVFVEVLDKIC